MSNDRTVLVLGGTGQQGGAVARHLTDRGWSVRALVRDPQKEAAQDLRSRGVELVRGDLDDPASVRQAMEGVYGVHSVQPLAEDGADEIRQGKLVADLAAELAVRHLVYSSVGGAERSSGIDHFETKGEIERHIGALGVPATVLRPVFFMENFPDCVEAEDDGRQLISLPLPPTCRLQVIATDDIGRLSAAAFADPDTYVGRYLEIAGDEPTLAEVAEIFTRATGKPTRFEEMPRDTALEAFGGEEGMAMLDWFRTSGYQADVKELRAEHPELLTLEDYLRTR